MRKWHSKAQPSDRDLGKERRKALSALGPGQDVPQLPDMPRRDSLAAAR